MTKQEETRETLEDILRRYGNFMDGYDADNDELDINEALEAILSYLDSQDRGGVMKFIGHYVVEGLSVLVIGGITIAYMTYGGWETPVIIAAIGAIGVIAGLDIHKRAQNKGG